jgi:hypothetical protein
MQAIGSTLLLNSCLRNSPIYDAGGNQIRKPILLLLASMLLFGCTSGVTLLKSQSAARYTNYTSGQIPRVIHGNPFGGSKAAFNQAAASAEQTLLRHPLIEFTVHNNAASLTKLYAVLAFNAPRSMSSWKLCDGKSVNTTISDKGKINLLVAICSETKAIG